MIPANNLCRALGRLDLTGAAEAGAVGEYEICGSFDDCFGALNMSEDTETAVRRCPSLLLSALADAPADAAANAGVETAC